MTLDQLLGITNMGGAAALSNLGIKEARDAGTAQQTALTDMANKYQSDIQFKPYTVTGDTGSSTFAPGGGASTLSPQLQALMNQLLTSSGGMFSGAAQPLDQRAMDVTAQLEAASAPSRQREYLSMEQRLFNQGRGGLQTAQYGGAPEQFAFAKALEEQRAQNALMGRTQAMNEQTQQLNIGQGLFNNAFVPQQQMNMQTQVNTPFAELINRAQQQGAVTGGELAGQGTQARIAGETQANNLRQVQLQGLLDALNAPAGGGTSFLGSLLGKLFGGGTSSTPAGFVTPTAAQQNAALNLP